MENIGENHIHNLLIEVFLAEHQVLPHLASGALVRVLEPWCQPYSGFFLYYPSVGSSPPLSRL
jgi:DNA-binding transcriptional LysR family regulator